MGLGIWKNVHRKMAPTREEGEARWQMERLICVYDAGVDNYLNRDPTGAQRDENEREAF